VGAARGQAPPHGKLIIVENAGHGVQSQGDAKALEAVRGLVASLG
jgi:hypothetical protein